MTQLNYPHRPMNSLAQARYKVGQPRGWPFPFYTVTAGDGQRVLFSGNQSVCEHVARRLAEAFQDGGFALHNLRQTELAPSVAPVSAEPVAWANFPSYLIDHCEGDTITEEGIQRALAAMLKDPKYAAPVAAQAQQVDRSTEMQGKPVDDLPNLHGQQQPVSGADGLNEWAEFDQWFRLHSELPPDVDLMQYDETFLAHAAWKARAALAQQDATRQQQSAYEVAAEQSQRWRDAALANRGAALTARAALAQHLSQQNAETVACGCGDMFSASSYGAGFIAAAGHCENCDAAQGTDADLLRYLLKDCIETDENGWLQIRFETARHRSNHDIGESAQWVREDIIDAARKEAGQQPNQSRPCSP